MAANAPPAVRQGYPLPPAPAAQPSDLEKEMAAVAEEMGIKVDKSVPSWMGGNIPPKDRERVRKEAERRIAEREGVNNGTDFIAAAAQ
jgi:hypothetical protein